KLYKRPRSLTPHTAIGQASKVKLRGLGHRPIVVGPVEGIIGYPIRIVDGRHHVACASPSGTPDIDGRTNIRDKTSRANILPSGWLCASAASPVSYLQDAARAIRDNCKDRRP